jgi:hypothetical protein
MIYLNSLNRIYLGYILKELDPLHELAQKMFKTF